MKAVFKTVSPQSAVNHISFLWILLNTYLQIKINSQLSNADTLYLLKQLIL